MSKHRHGIFAILFVVAALVLAPIIGSGSAQAATATHTDTTKMQAAQATPHHVQSRQMGTTQDADTSIEVTSTATSTATAKVESTVIAKVNGATQLLWWVPNGHWKVTKKQVQKAPHITVHATKANASKVIAKKAHGASIVVLKPGSKVRNTGPHGGIVGGFIWPVKVPAVLKWNKHLGLYQHVYNWQNGHLSQPKCGNHIGGHVHMYKHVVQVRIKGDLRMKSKVSATAHAEAEAVADGTCPNGTQVHAKASASSDASALAAVFYKLKLKVASIHGTKLNLTSQVTGQAEADAKAKAMVKIDIKCGGTVVQPPAISASAEACVQQGQNNGVVDFAVINNDSQAHDANVTISAQGVAGQTLSQVPGNGGQKSGKFNGIAPGNYTLTATMPDLGLSATTQVMVSVCAVIPGSIVSIEQPNDVLYGNTRTIKVTGTVPAGQPNETLKSSAIIGSIASADQSVSVSGDFTVYVHYTAPTEGSSDTVTVKLFSSTGHLDDQGSVTFALTKPNPDPQ
jgi:hypothetical protein